MVVQQKITDTIWQMGTKVHTCIQIQMVKTKITMTIIICVLILAKVTMQKTLNSTTKTVLQVHSLFSQKS